MGIYFSIDRWADYLNGTSPFNIFDENGDIAVDKFMKLKIERQNSDGDSTHLFIIKYGKECAGDATKSGLTDEQQSDSNIFIFFRIDYY